MYYDIEVKQLISDKADQFEVVFNSGEEDEFIMEVIYFALCDLHVRLTKQELFESDGDAHEIYQDVILPVLFDDDEGLMLELTSHYKAHDEQNVILRRKTQKAGEKQREEKMTSEYVFVDHLGEYVKRKVERLIQDHRDSLPQELTVLPDDRIIALIVDMATPILRKIEDDAVSAGIEGAASLIRYSLKTNK